MAGETAHGGLILTGFPGVLIGGMPAARMVDMTFCPLFTPVRPVPVPHVGGPILMGSPTVIIGGMPAASMADMTFCVGPPNMVANGFPGVVYG